MIIQNTIPKYWMALFLLAVLPFFTSCNDKNEEDIVDEVSVVEEPKDDGAPEHKKGVCMSYKNATWSTRVSRLKAHWHYSWGNELKENEPENVEYVPMFWGKKVEDATLTYLKQLKEEGKIEYLLGFNEPDGVEQANMTVDEAIALWPKLEEVGVPLGSPATVGNPSNNEWLKDFMTKAEAQGLRVDFVCMHSYGGLNADGLMDKIKEAYDMYGKPIWITEFAVGDWNATTPSENKYSADQVLNFMKEILPKLEEAEYVHRYAWYNGKTTDAPLASSVLFDENDGLTPLGEYYAEFEANAVIGAGKDDPVDVVVEDPDNIIVNGGFETGEVEPWGGYKSAPVGEATTTAFEGNYCGRIENNDGAIFQIISLEAGKTYDINFQSMWSEETEHSFAMVIKDEAGEKAVLHSLDIPKNTEWTENKTKFTCPDGVSSVRFVLYKGKTDPAMPPFFVDNVVIKETTDDGDNPDEDTDVKVTAVSLSTATVNLNVGDTKQLVAEISPANANNLDVSWSSSDEAVVSVDSKGLITAVAEGSADITVTTVDGGFTAVSKITVVESAVAVTGINISLADLALNVGGTSQLSAEVLPEDATDKSHTWSSSDEAVATVAEDGTVTAIAAGEADITVTSVDGSFTAVCKVNVSLITISVTGLNISSTSMSLLIGENAQLSVEVLPADATDKSVVWSSSDESIATVATDGTVTAVSKGTATITVVSNDGNFSKTCEVTIDENKTVVENLIVNGDFETGESDPWSGYKSGAVGEATTTAFEGSYCGRIERNDGSLFQVISVEAGKTYEVSFQSKWIEATTNTFSLKIKEEGGAKATLHSYDIPKDTDWKANTTEFVCPAGISSVRFLLYKGKTSPVLPSFFIDNVVIKEKL